MGRGQQKTNLMRTWFKKGKYDLAQVENICRCFADYACIAYLKCIIEGIVRLFYRTAPVFRIAVAVRYTNKRAGVFKSLLL